MAPLVNEVNHPVASSSATHHIFFIPGNPGFVSYYRAFLAIIYDSLNNSDSAKGRKSHHVNVFGKSLGGFEVEENLQAHEPQSIETRQPFSLQQQIEYAESNLARYAQSQRTKIDKSSPIKIILIAHSVGSYILLEILRRHNALRAKAVSGVNPVDYDIVAGILLFPTIVDIGISPAGVTATRLLNLPFFILIASIWARILVRFIPRRLLEVIVGKTLDMPEDSAQTTAEFLQGNASVSEGGAIRQALVMARDEMNTINADVWDDEIWGSMDAMPTGKSPKLYFYFGRHDRWVAERTRDDIIAKRAETRDKNVKTTRPVMEVDELGTRHGFCIPRRETEIVAKKTVEYITEILGST